MEYAPYGGHRVRMTASERRDIRRKIIKGGKIADELRKMAKQHHTEHEVPRAEREIDRKLQEVNGEPKSENPLPISQKLETPLSFWKKIQQTLKRLFLP